MITSNGTQVANKGIKEIVKELNIKKHFTPVEHHQKNGRVESTSKVILRSLMRRLGEAKADWPEGHTHMMWAYHTTPHPTTGETSFRLTFGTKVVAPAEVNALSWKAAYPINHNANIETTLGEPNFIDESRNLTALTETAIKKDITTRYDRKVRPRDFESGNVVPHRADVGNKNAREGKLGENMFHHLLPYYFNQPF